MSLTNKLKQAGKKALPFLLATILLNPIQAQEKKEKSDFMYKAGEISYVVLNYLDYATTQRALQNGAVELNPVMKYMINQNMEVPFKVGTTGLFLYLLRQIKKEDEKKAKKYLLTGNLFYGALVLRNYLLNKKFQKQFVN